MSYEDFINNILNNLYSFQYNSKLEYIDLFNNQIVNGLWYINRNGDISLDLDRVNYSFSYNSNLLLVITNNNESRYLLNTFYFTKDRFEELKKFMNENQDVKKFQPKDYTDLSKGWRKACNIEGQYNNGEIGVCCEKLVANEYSICKKSS